MTTTSDPHVATLIGRDAILGAASEALRCERAVAIAGPGGVGKTAVALEYMRRSSSRYRQILWMNARMREMLLADCIGWSTHLGLSLLWDEPLPLMIQPLRDWLAAQQDYLLILDSADDPSLIEAIFPTRLAGHVLRTTRAGATAEEGSRLQLDNLNAVDGALLLLRRARLIAATAQLEQVEKGQASAAMELAQEMGGLPLALDLAGATITETNRSVRDYHLAYQQCSPPQTDFQTLPGDVNQAVAKACALAYAALEERTPAAVARLRTCAFLAPDAIQATLLTGDQVTVREGREQATSPLDTLMALRLINPQQSSHMLRMHLPVQAALRARLAPDEQQQGKEQAMQAVHRQLIAYDQATIMPCLRYMAHIKHIDALSDQWTFHTTEEAEVFSWAAMILYKQENYAEALALQRKALAIWERSPGADSPDTAAALHNLAAIYEQSGGYAQAEDTLHRAVQLRAASLGAEHPDTILSLGNLGYVYAEQDKAVEAEATYRKALSLCERRLGLEDPLPKQIQYNMARLYIERSRFSEAEALLRSVSSYYERTLGAKHLITAKALHMLANATLAQERWQESEALLQRIIPIFEGASGAPHMEVVECLHQLMLLYATLDKKDNLETTARRLLAIREAQAQGNDSPETVVSLAGLAGVFIGAGRFAEAESLLQRALAMCERMPEMGPANMAILLNTLAAAYIQHGQRDAALTTLQRAFHTWEQALGQNTQDIAALREEYQRVIASLG